MKDYKNDGVRMWKMTFTRKNYNEAVEEVKEILNNK